MTTQQLLIASQSSNIGFLQSGVGALPRTAESKMQDTVSPMDFGAVGDGVFDDKAALLAAFATGKVVDGGGRTYAVTGTTQPTVFAGFQNATLLQLNQSSIQACCTLYILNKNNFFIRNVKINRGNQPVPNAAYASNPNGALNFVFGLKIEGSSGTYSKNFTLDNVEVTGDGSGNGIGLWWVEQFSVNNCYVHDMNSRVDGSTDDNIQGIWFSGAANGTISNCRVEKVYSWSGSAYTNIYGRGFTFGNTRNCTITNCNANWVEQCFDFTGTDGNRFLSISNCFADLGGTVGFKFANSSYDIVVTGCTALRCGWYGFLVSGMTDPNDPVPARVDFVGCQAINSGYITSRPTTTHKVGFLVDRQPNVDGYQPRSIRFIGCFVKDNQTPKTTVKGFVNTVFVAEYPTAGYNKNWANVVIDCQCDEGITFTDGISPNLVVTRRSSTQTISNNTWTAVQWNDDVYDGTGLHNTSSNNDIVYIKSPGFYRVDLNALFDADAAGGRLARIHVNGTAIDGTTVRSQPASGQGASVTTSCVRFFNTGDQVQAFVYQDSGGNLDLTANGSLFSVVKTES